MFLTNLNSDSSHPSFFEMFAQSALTSSLKPALKHGLAALARHIPALASAPQHTDEIFFGLLYVLEKHFLQEHDSTFAENFYSLKRVRLHRGADHNAAPTVVTNEASNLAAPAATASSAASSSSVALPANPKLAAAVLNSQREAAARGEHSMSEFDRIRSLFFLIAVPYLKTKADAWYEAATDPTEEHVLRDYENELPWLHRVVRRHLIKLYPLFHAIYEGMQLAYQIAYLAGRTQYFSPWLHLLSLKVRRLALHDMWADNHKAQNPAPLPPLSLTGAGSLFQLIRNLISRSWSFAAEYAKWGIVGAIFLYKMVEWYNSADAAAAGVRADVLPVAPPPEPVKSAFGALSLPSDPSICPLCRKTRTNPTAPLCSGVVYCYPCIHSYVTHRQQCPVTQLPCTTAQLRKIFAD